MAKTRPPAIDLGTITASTILRDRPAGVDEGQWYWRARRRDTRETVWTGWATKADATAALVALLGRGLAPSSRAARGAGGVRTVGDLLDEWVKRQEIRKKAGSLAPRTVANYRAYAGYWKEAVGGVLVHCLSCHLVEDTRDEWLSEGLAVRTVQVAVRVLNICTNWGHKRGLCPDLDLRGVAPNPGPDDYVNIHTTPTPAEVARVLAAMPDDDMTRAVRLLAWTGARAGEIVALTVGSYDRDSGMLTLYGRDTARARLGKTPPRRFPLPAQARELLEDLVRGRSPEEPLLALPRTAAAGMGKRINEACAAAEVERFSPHGIRRMVVMRLLDAGVDVKTISLLTGHSVQILLRDYVRPREDDLRRAVARAGLGNLGEGQGQVLELEAGKRK